MTAHIGILTIRLALPADTLKEKRSIVKSTVERLRSKYNAAIAEIDDLDNPGLTTLVAVCVSNQATHADAQLQSIAGAIERARLDVQVVEISTELIAL